MTFVKNTSAIHAGLAVAALLLWLPVATSSAAQVAPATSGNAAKDLKLDAAMRKDVIEGVLKNINRNYAYPEAAKQMDKAIRERLRRGEYDGIDSGAKLAKVLTGHLQEVREDPHLRVEFTADPGAPDQPTGSTAQTPEERRAEREHWPRFG